MSTRKPATSARRPAAAPSPGVTASGPRADLGILLTLALASFKDRLHFHLASAGYEDLGPAYGFVFRSLGEQSLSLAELAVRLAITPQGALKIVAEMIEHGYVERRDDVEDKRVRRLLLTVRGRAALREARRFHARAERDLVDQLGAHSVAAARAVLAALAATATPDARWGHSARPF
ncbi:MAG TPA: MarR family transcriptional regulator [Gemmatimonadaceae bacterium]